MMTDFPTPYPDVNLVLNRLLAGARDALGERFVGLYLHGSLADSDFNPETSDIDFLVVTAGLLPDEIFSALGVMHAALRAEGSPWAGKLEGAYLPRAILRRHDPAMPPIPWLGSDGHFARETLGSDWILQRWILREKGIVIAGTPLTGLIDPISPDELREAVRGSLREWWSPPFPSPGRFESDEYRAYAALTMCRSLYVLAHGRIASKPEAARWAQETLGLPWADLAARAAAWRPGEEFSDQEETFAFIYFTGTRSLEGTGSLKTKELMNLTDLIHRNPRPAPWTEGEKIPWNEPGFSARMLHEHLSQDHDAASRRFAVIDRHVDWIHTAVLGGGATRILDLGCGPGLYASRLARLGHTCTGIDFSPASVAYAKEQAAAQGLDCTYTEGDIRKTEFGSGFGLVLLVYGEFNVFHPDDTRRILRKAHAALDEGGTLLLEPHTFAAVRQIGEEPPSWYSSPSGLFSERPHIYLMENFWDEATCTATNRYYIVDAATGAVTPYASTMQAYTDEEYRALLEECGFRDVQFHPSLEGKENEHSATLLAITAGK